MGLFDFKHLFIILLVAMVVFGTKNIRSLGGDVGGWIRDFKKALKDGENDANQAAATPPPPAQQAQPAAQQQVIEGEQVVAPDKHHV